MRQTMTHNRTPRSRPNASPARSVRRPQIEPGHFEYSGVLSVGMTLVAKAVARVVVDHAGSLHESVADGRSDESEAAAFQVLAHGVRFACARGYAPRGRPFVLLWPAADKLPDVTVERAKFLLYLEECLRVRNCRRDFQAVAHDSRVRQQRADFSLVIARNLRGIEAVKSAAVILALVENRLPTQPRLRAFENQKLKKHAVVVHRLAPLFVMVFDHERLLRPMTAPPLLA